MTPARLAVLVTVTALGLSGLRAETAAMPLAVSTAQTAMPDGPSLATEVALGCLLGMGRDGCENLMVGADRNPIQNSGSLSGWDVRRRTSYCSGDYIYRALDYCPDGFLETVQYLGENREGDDVYLVQFMHADKTYVISQLTPQGKIRKFWIFNNPPIRILTYKKLVELRTPTRAPRTIYSREAPAQGGIRPENPQRHGVGDPIRVDE
jgi:hypothetical protein